MDKTWQKNVHAVLIHFLHFCERRTTIPFISLDTTGIRFAEMKKSLEKPKAGTCSHLKKVTTRKIPSINWRYASSRVLCSTASRVILPLAVSVKVSRVLWYNKKDIERERRKPLFVSKHHCIIAVPVQIIRNRRCPRSFLLSVCLPIPAELFLCVYKECFSCIIKKKLYSDYSKNKKQHNVRIFHFNNFELYSGLRCLPQSGARFIWNIQRHICVRYGFWLYTTYVHDTLRDWKKE